MKKKIILNEEQIDQKITRIAHQNKLKDCLLKYKHKY